MSPVTSLESKVLVNNKFLEVTSSDGTKKTA